MIDDDRLRHVDRVAHEAKLKERGVLVEQHGRHRFRNDLLAVEPNFDKAFLGIAGPQDVDGEVVPVAGSELAFAGPVAACTARACCT